MTNDAAEQAPAYQELERTLEALRAGEATLRSLYATLEQRVEERTRESERRRRVAEGLRDILAILNSNRPLREILDYIATQSSQLLGSDACLIYRFEQGRQRMVMESEYGLPPDYRAMRSGPTYLTPIARAALDRQPAAITDLRAYASPETFDSPELDVFHHQWLEATSHHFQSALGVPVIVRGEMYGGLVFYYRRQREFSEEDFRLGVSLGDHAALAIENARLRAQAEQIAVLRERERLARELHDSVTQSLYSLTLLSEAGRRLVEAEDLEQIDEVLIRLEEVGQQALKEMRLLVYELRPLVLRREGLVGALQQRLDAVEKRAGIEARLLVEGDVKLPMTVERELYRVAQEALNNALKHAQATSIAVRIRAQGDQMALEVVDNGKGFDPEKARAGGGMGLTSMRERVQKIRGALEITSSPGTGTKVSVMVQGLPSVSGEDSEEAYR